MKKVLVCGAGGFIGSHLVRHLKKQGCYVVGVDLKAPEFSKTPADEFHLLDLRVYDNVLKVLTTDIDEVYQLAADMGGAGYIFTGENDANIMHNSAQINLNVLDVMQKRKVNKVLYTSSACIYPSYNQTDPRNPNCSESSAYPADPDSEYGWEKLFSERLYLSYSRNYGISSKIVRLHNVYGPESNWTGGREKAPAALCRKVIESKDSVEIWGTGEQTRSFMYIDDCIEGIDRIMNSDIDFPINLGSEEMISINDFAKLIIDISGKELKLHNVSGPLGVMGRNSDNRIIREHLNWEPTISLREGIEKTYRWIEHQLKGPWIYESPDGGKTNYRRRFGAPHHTRELITG